GSSQPPPGEETLAEFVQRKFGADVLSNLVDPLVSTIFLSDPEKMGMESAFPSLVAWEREYGSVARGAIRTRSSRENGAGTARSRAATGARGSLFVTDALPSLGSFRLGIGTLPEKLAEELQKDIRYRTKITSIAESPEENGRSRGGWGINLGTGEKIEAEHLVLAVPAHAAAELLCSVRPPLAAHL